MPDPDEPQLPREPMVRRPEQPTLEEVYRVTRQAMSSPCVGCRQNTERIARVETKIAELEERIDALEAKIAKLDEHLELQLGHLKDHILELWNAVRQPG